VFYAVEQLGHGLFLIEDNAGSGFECTNERIRCGFIEKHDERCIRVRVSDGSGEVEALPRGSRSRLALMIASLTWLVATILHIEERDAERAA
jgi:hypothetical protein